MNPTTHSAVTVTSASASSSTPSSPVMVENPTTTISSSSSSSTSSPLLVSSDAGEMTDDDMNLNSPTKSTMMNDPLLLQPPSTVLEASSSPPSEPNSTKSNMDVTTATMKSIHVILERYSIWFMNQWQGFQPSKLYSSSSSSSSFQQLLSPSKVEWLKWYIQFMTSPSHQDKILKFLQYSLYMMSQVLVVVQSSRDGNHSRSNTTTKASTLSQQWLEKLYQEFTWTRYVLRILQFPMALDAAIHQSWTITATATPMDVNATNDDAAPNYLATTTTSRQKIYNLLGRILTYSMVLYYPTELMAYLLWMKPKISTRTSTTMTASQDNVVVPKSSPSSSTTTTATLVCDPRQGYIVSYIYKYYTTLLDSQHQYHNTSSISSSRKMSTLSWLFQRLNSFVTPSTYIRCCPTPETWSYLSSRCWLIYVITELIQSYIQYKELLLLSKSSPNIDDDDDNNNSNTTSHEHQKHQIVLQMVRNLLFLIPCTTWSMSQWDTQPIVPTRTVNTLLWFESIVSLYQAIQNTTK